MPLLGALLLAGCGGAGQGPSLSPVDWWHHLEGGTIAENRPPPPNADAPYPNLATVPPRPPPPDVAAQARIADALVADRRNAQYAERTTPLPHLPPPAGTPAALRRAAQATDPDQPGASLAAASAPARPAPLPSGPVAVRKAPLAAVAAAPLEAPPAPPATPATPAQPASASPQPAAEPAMPEIPASPPSPPRIAGAPNPPAVTAPTPPPIAPSEVPKPAAVVGGKPVAIPFPTGSAVLPGVALPSIKLLARQRGTASIAVTGFGEATSDDTGAQSAALPLALNRAQAVAAVLMADGVPGSAIRLDARPQGSGAAARLVNGAGL